MYVQLKAVVHLELPTRSTPLTAELLIDSDEGDIQISVNDRKEARNLLDAIESGKPHTVHIVIEED